jgi:hypothetical protein
LIAASGWGLFFEDINQAIEDSEKGITIKPIIKIGEYKG